MRNSEDGHSLRTLLNGPNRNPPSVRSSLEIRSLAQRECRISIYDQHEHSRSSQADLEEPQVARFRLAQSSPNTPLPVDLRRRLDNRNSRLTRWINIEGWSPGLADDLTNRFLENHGCLHLDDMGSQTLGGPIRRADDSYFVWLQTPIWWDAASVPSWSGVRRCRLRIVVCLPTASTAGTVITNFLGHPPLAERVSNALSQDLLENHSMGTEALTCVWALVFSILRLTAQQLSLAWRTLDPLEYVSQTPPAHSQLWRFLEAANALARLDRYISGLHEIVSFFDAVRRFQRTQQAQPNDQDQAPNLSKITPRSELESNLAKDRISHAHRICRTYIQQYESQVSLMMSHSTTEIIQQLDSGQRLGDRLTTIGLVLAGMTFISTPFVMITGYYGMNVVELVDGGYVTLFEFWQAVLPVLAVCTGLSVIVALRIMRQHKSA